MATATHTVEGFSLSHAAILTDDGVEHEFGDIYGIRSGTLSVDTDSYDNTGDNAVLSSWYWFNTGNVTIQAGYVPFETISMLQGTDITSGTDSIGKYVSMPLWNENSLNQQSRPMLIRVPAKSRQGKVKTIDFYLFKVQFEPISFDGPTYRDGLLLNYGGKALMSDVDEKGNPLPGGEKAIGRMVIRDGNVVGNTTTDAEGTV